MSAWPPLRDVDVGVVDSLNAAVSERPWAVTALQLVTDLGGAEAAWILLPVAVVWLLIRRLPRLAAYVAVTGLGAAVLNTGVKALVDRARPVVDTPLLETPAAGFPSGHAMGSTITYGVLLLVFLPVVPVRLRRSVTAGAVVLVAAIGLTRIALGVHYPSDVFAGWLLGMLWLTVTAVAFRSWRQEEGLGERPARERPAREGLAPEDRAALEPAPAHEAPLPAGWVAVAVLVTAGVMIWGAFVGLGLLMTDVLAPVRQVDMAVIEWFAQVRTQTLTPVVVAVSHLGSTIGIVLALLVAVPLALGLTRRWGPPLFLVVVTVGETALFLAISTVVGRQRPEVDPLSAALPPTSSFPSGHVAAAFATYGGIALLVLAWTRGRLAYLVLVVAVLAVVGVALARVYRGVHYPSDTLASLLFTAAWLAACWWAFRPGRGSPSAQDHAGPDTDQGARTPSPASAVRSER
nr:phosphatase PAP2 family protein [Ornithinimicrobium sediminis]